MTDDMYGSGINLPKAVLDAQAEAQKNESSLNDYVPGMDPITFQENMRKVWDVPIIMRQNLRESLNSLSEGNYEIFAILPIDKEKVQVICYRKITTDN